MTSNRNEKITTMEMGDWIIRQRIPGEEGPHPIIVMLHGWTGDEDAMWIFAQRLPKNALLLSLRGFFTAPFGGYSWHEQIDKVWPDIDDFQPAIEKLKEILRPSVFPDADFGNLRFLGFSQGAALAFSWAFIHPEKTYSLAGLSGFLPEGIDDIIKERPLVDKTIFLAHGSQDQLVPVERARLSVELLNRAGAQITYCEDNVGHKLSASCFSGMETFFKRD